MTPQQMQMMQQMMAAQKGGGGQAAGGMGGLQGGGTGGLKGLNKGGGQQQQGAPQMPAGMPPGMDMGALMKNLPPGTQLPTGQAGPASIGGGGTPDMSKLMQNLPQQNTGGGPMPGLGDQSQQGH
jgi:hypothetical protein